MKRPWIAIPCGMDARSDGVLVHGVNWPYIRSVQEAGGRVLLIPAGDPEAAAELLSRADGLLLVGGPDTDPARYGQSPEPRLGPLDKERDELDFNMFAAAQARDLPVFGICRGQQVINVALGGSLLQHLPAHASRAELGRQHFAHRIDVQPQSRLAELVGRTDLEVNSFHHQAIARLAPGLQAVAHSPDGVIEALESAGGRILAMQCHPEELAASREWAARLFRAFVEQAAHPYT